MTTPTQPLETYAWSATDPAAPLSDTALHYRTGRPAGQDADAPFGPQTDALAPYDASPARASRMRMTQSRYWTGAVLTAAVAALAGTIGMVVAHGIVRVPVLFAGADGLVSVSALTYALIMVAVALGAAAVYDVMLYLAPRPLVFYTWIAGLLTALAVLVPLTTSAALASRLSLAAMNLVVGLTVLVLIPVAAENARTTR